MKDLNLTDYQVKILSITLKNILKDALPTSTVDILREIAVKAEQLDKSS